MTTVLFAFFLALAPAALLAHTISPSATVLNQLLCIGGWGVCLALVSLRSTDKLMQRTTALTAAAVIYMLAALVGWQALGVPASIALSAVATIVAALVVMAFGVRCADEPTDIALTGFDGALVLVGVFDVVIALIQVFAPDLADGDLIAKSGLAGRAIGNLRQPNHLSSLALWSAVAVVPLVDGGKLPKSVGALLFALFVFSIELSASRTGMVGVGVITVWGLVDRRLARFTRVMLVAAALVFAAGWAGMSDWASDTHHTFGAAARLGESDISGSRYGIWKNAVALIRHYPLTGVGFGEFNFAWTLTPFPGRPTAFFDHTHNIVLQLVVELGLPLGGLMVLLLIVALVQAGVRAWRVQGPAAAGYRSAFVMVLLVALHSQLEYPLWYAYFLLPAAWAWGYCLGGHGLVTAPVADTVIAVPVVTPAAGMAASEGALVAASSAESAGGIGLADSAAMATGIVAPPHASNAPLAEADPTPTPTTFNRHFPHFFAIAGCIMIAGAAWSFVDYRTVSYIFEPDASDKHTLAERIAAGRKSLFYTYHADYAAVTVAEHPSTEWPSFRTAPHYLLDTRLMIAWANAFAERGDLDHARYIADRLREFNKDDADDYFAPCDADPVPQPLPYQCTPASRPIDWHEFKAPGLWK